MTAPGVSSSDWGSLSCPSLLTAARRLPFTASVPLLMVGSHLLLHLILRTPAFDRVPLSKYPNSPFLPAPACPAPSAEQQCVPGGPEGVVSPRGFPYGFTTGS